MQIIGQKGFSFLELIIAMTLGLVILAALTRTFVVQRKVFGTQEQILEMAQTARAGMEMITSEVMMAGFDPSGLLQHSDDTKTTFSGIVYDDTKSELEIRADLNGNGMIVKNGIKSKPKTWSYDKNERIVYKLIGGAIKRKTGKGYFQPFVENVQSFSFDYKKLDGTIATNESEIRQVLINIEVKTEEPEINGGFKRKTLSSLVMIRNLGLD